MLNTILILGVKITSESREGVLEYFFETIKNTKNKLFVITPNPEMLVYASRHLDYKNKLNCSSISLPDGIGLFFAAGLSGKILNERVTGVDFLEDLCREAREKPVSMGFLGGKAGVAKRTAECLLRKYPYLNIVFVSEEWNKDDSINKKVAKRESPTKIDVLFVAFGIPKQEEWIYENLKSLPIRAAIGVGGSFDFISGEVQRAPFIIRAFGFEWLFRLITQPWRWRRQLALIDFILLVFRERFSTATEK